MSVFCNRRRDTVKLLRWEDEGRWGGRHAARAVQLRVADARRVGYLASAHFCAHQPYHRFEKQLERLGVSLPRSTQVWLMAQLNERVAPMVEAIGRRVWAGGYIHLDVPPIDLLDAGRPGGTQGAPVWGYRAHDESVWFEYARTKTPARPTARRARSRPRPAWAKLKYLLGQQSHLRRCLSEPRAQLDNDPVERAIRPLKIGAENRLFIGHPNAGPSLANLFTLLQNCRLVSADPETDRVDLIARLPDSPKSASTSSSRPTGLPLAGPPSSPPSRPAPRPSAFTPKLNAYAASTNQPGATSWG